MHRPRFAFSFIASLVLAATTAQAAVITNWTGTGNWTNDPGNWSDGVPTDADTANINSGTATIDGTSSLAEADVLHVNSGTTVHINGGTLQVGGQVQIGVTTSVSTTSQLIIASGTLQIGTGGNLVLEGHGQFTDHAGHSLTVNNLTMAPGGSGSLVATSTFNQSGQVHVAGDLQVAIGSTNRSSVYNLNPGAVLTFGTSSNLELGGNATFNHDIAGTTLVPGNLLVGSIDSINYSNAFNLNSGTVEVGGHVRIGRRGTNDGGGAHLVIAPGASLKMTGLSGNLELDGGAMLTDHAGHALAVPGDLVMGVADSGSAVRTSTVNQFGDITVNNLFLAQGSSNRSAVYNLNSGKLTVGGTAEINRIGTMNVAGGELAVNGNFTIGTISGALESKVEQTGGLVTVGADLRLAPLSGRQGEYHLLGGALDVAGTMNLALNGAPVFVLDGGTLSATTISDPNGVFNYQSGRLSPGLGAISTMTFNGNLVLPSTAELLFDLTTPEVIGGGVNDLLHVNGNLVLDGVVLPTGLDDFSIPEGLYPIITFTGSLSGSLSTSFPSLASIVIEMNEGPGGTVFLMVVTPIIPEPSTALLLSCGLAALLPGRRRRFALSTRIARQQVPARSAYPAAAEPKALNPAEPPWYGPICPGV